MKRFLTLLLCFVLVASTVLCFASCGDEKKNNNEETSKADVTTVADETTEAEETTVADEETTIAEETTVEEETTVADEETTKGEPTFAEGDIVISSAEDFINFNKSVFDDFEEYSGITVYFTADIDMAGYDWKPMDGSCLDSVTFDGQGHTIKNLTMDNIEPEMDSMNGNMDGTGLIANAHYDLTFKDLKFDTVNIKCYKRHGGTLVGAVYSNAWITVDNVDMVDVNIIGALENDEEAGISFCIRQSAYIGALFEGGQVEFKDCELQGAHISGFHNCAAFVGYDGTNQLYGDCFTNCSVFDMELEFSYCQSASYTVNKPFRFVSVFFNSTQWLDNIDDCKDAGNFYGNVTAIDWTTGKSYNIDDFRSWTDDSDGYLAYIGGTGFADIEECYNLQ